MCLAAAGVLGPLSLWLTSGERNASAHEATFPVQKSDAEWRAALTRDRYRILRGHSTERAFSSPLNAEKRNGIVRLRCAAARSCSRRSTKFESGTGWPSFWRPIDGAVGTEIDSSWLMVRTEVHCARCGSHLGHVFADGPAPTGLRYCINGLALDFVRVGGHLKRTLTNVLLNDPRPHSRLGVPMRTQRLILIAAVVLGVGYGWLRGGFVGLHADSQASARRTGAAGGLQKATFAGGCFWCVEADFDKLRGVISTTSGYTGGRSE